MENDNMEQLLGAYGPRILHLAYVYLHSREDAEDVLQDTMVQYLRRAPRFQSREHEKAWLLRVAVNLCKNRLRAPWHRVTELPDDFPSQGIPEESIGLLQAVSALPVSYREVIHLFYYEEATTAQIAAVLGKREATVRSLLSRGRKLLKQKLDGEA